MNASTLRLPRAAPSCLAPTMLLLAALLLAPAATAQAATASFGPVADATLYESPQGTLANGGGDHMFAGLTIGQERRRALVAFDVAGNVPAGARVVEVTLAMFVSRSTYFPDLPVALHRVSTTWGEGTANASGQEGMGTTAQNGDATWLHSSRPLPWTSPGGDFAAAPSGVSATPYFGACQWDSTSAMVQDVQGWLDDPAGNFGWLLRTDEAVGSAVRRFDTREHPFPQNHPLLQVRYVLPGQWATVGAGCGASPPSLVVGGTLAGGGSVTFTLQAAPGLLAANFLALGPPVLPPLPLAGSCALYLPPLALSTPGFAVTDAAGAIQDTLPIPASPALGGVELSGQGGLLDPGAPDGFVLSNAAFAVLQ